MHLLLQRLSSTPDCTMGAIGLPSGTALQTLELPWIPSPDHPAGMPDMSCVPAGVYALEAHNTVKHPKTFALVNAHLGVLHEPDPEHPECRTACLIHVANRPRDLEGCIGIGMDAQPCLVLNSRVAMGIFQAEVPWGNGHTLEIRDAPQE